MVGDDAVPGGEDVGQVGAHLSVDGDRAFDAELDAGVGGQFGVGANPDNDEHEVGRAGHGRPAAASGMDSQRAGPARAA